MPNSTRAQSKSRADAKSQLNRLKMTTAIGAVGLTLAGWGVLAQVEASSAAASAQDPIITFIDPAANGAPLLVSAPSRGRIALAQGESKTVRAAQPITTPTPTATRPATPAGEVVPDSGAPVYKLDIVQWVQSNSGDPVAVVRDGSGVLWYVWGTDVPLIEQGRSPQFQPQPVNSSGRSRHS